jgi:hypothetical protein
VLLAAVGQGEKAFGLAHAGAVLRNTGAGWRLLLLLPQFSLPQLEEWFQSFDTMGLEDSVIESVPQVTLLAPANHAQLPRFPSPDIEWEATGSPLASFVVEWQFSNLGREQWTWSGIRIMRPVTGETSVRMSAPFGVGMQPHRWRVWAITTNGIASFSEWRIIDFTN